MTVLLLVGLVASAAPVAPPGFVVTEFAGADLANDIYALHISKDGRIVVTGRGYARELIDVNGDGVADQAVDLVTGLKDGPMGVLIEKDVMFLVADGGLKRYRHTPGKPSDARQAEVILPLKTAGEHDAHMARRGADGWLYLLCGNTAGVATKLVPSTDSPIKNPTAGTFLRINPDGKQVEVMAEGFRNAYDFDFHPTGDPFTFDSDNERCAGLPWYEPTRFYRVLPGGHYGWLNPQIAQTWRRPPYFWDVVPPVAECGRGSPTGVACYRQTAFPVRYHGGFFLGDWTFGRVLFVPVDPADPAKVGTHEPFLQAVGESGFAPTGVAVHPKTGDLYVSTGGRGTRGAVFRVRPTKAVAEARPLALQPWDITQRRWRHQTADPLGRLNPLWSLRQRQLATSDFVDPKAVGSVWEGYTFRKSLPAAESVKLGVDVRACYPSMSSEYNRELTRTLAALGDPDPRVFATVAAMLTPTSDPVEDVHLLIVLARLTAPRTADTTRRIADALVRLDAKYDNKAVPRDRLWPVRLTEVVAALVGKDKTLPTAIIAHPDFGRASHTWLALSPGFDREAVARRVLAVSVADPEYAWSALHVGLLTALPDAEVRPHLENLWDRGGLEDALIPLLARTPIPADRPRLVTGLRSINSATVTFATEALGKLPVPADDSDLVPLVRALRRAGDGATEAPAREALSALLSRRTGEALVTAKDWEVWLRRTKPTLAAELSTGAYDPTAWKKRAGAIPWDSGDMTAGKRVYAKARCAACHDGTAAVGPDLAGVAGRFGRDDLLTAVIDPNKDVSPRYRVTRVSTDDGKVYQGVVIYEATDGLMLRTGTDDTVRVSGERVTSKIVIDGTLMPAGLLDPFSDREVADLFAYLKSRTVK